MRIETGVRGFDGVAGGRLPEGRLYVVSGPPGSGETTVAAHLLGRGSRSGQRCLYRSMYESEEEFASDTGEFDIGFERAVSAGRLRYPSVISELSEELLLPKAGGGFQRGVQSASDRIAKFVEVHDIERLVIDSTLLHRSFYDLDDDALVQFVSSLKRSDATALLVPEMTEPSSHAEAHYLAHGVISLHNYMEDEGDMRRWLRVPTMRDIDTDIRRLSFGRGGLAASIERVADGRGQRLWGRRRPAAPKILVPRWGSESIVVTIDARTVGGCGCDTAVELPEERRILTERSGVNP